MNGVIKIGGLDHNYEVLYQDIPKFYTRFNLIYYLCVKDFKKKNKRDFDKSNDKLIIPNQIYFWIMWKCLVKRSWGPFKKPFRSMNQMAKRIRKDEYQSIVDLAGQDILELTMSEDRDPGNENQSPSQNILEQ